jgi:hypothetical protein
MTAASSEAQAAAAAALLAGSAAALDRLGGAIGEEARALARSWAAMDRAARARGLAEAALAVQRAVPRGMSLVHREWIEAALAGEGAWVRAVIAGGASVPQEVATYLARRVLGQLVAMPRPLPWPPPDGVAIDAASLAAAPPAWIERALARAGLHQLAHATVPARGEPRSRAAIAAVAARLGDDGAAFVDAVAAVDAAGDAAAARWGPRRAAIARVQRAALGDDALAVIAIGARAFAPHLGGDGPRQVAQRLPRGVGTRVREELERARGGDAAPWSELVALPA